MLSFVVWKIMCFSACTFYFFGIRRCFSHSATEVKVCCCCFLAAGHVNLELTRELLSLSLQAGPHACHAGECWGVLGERKEESSQQWHWPGNVNNADKQSSDRLISVTLRAASWRSLIAFHCKLKHGQAQHWQKLTVGNSVFEICRLWFGPCLNALGARFEDK